MDEVLHKHFVHMNILLNQGRICGKEVTFLGTDAQKYPRNTTTEYCPTGQLQAQVLLRCQSYGLSRADRAQSDETR